MKKEYLNSGIQTSIKMSRSNRMKLKEFYKSKAREDAELVRNPDINLDASQFSRDAYIAKILRNLPLSALLGLVFSLFILNLDEPWADIKFET